MNNLLGLRHVLESQQFNPPLMETLFHKADSLRAEFFKDRQNLMRLAAGRLFYYLFWEPSTRTRMSFVTAAKHLGMQTEGTEDASQFSSTVKGETLEDTVRVLSSYGPDVIVMRHTEQGAAVKAAEFSAVPIINAGDGRGQHPTQALLDMYTIKREVTVTFLVLLTDFFR